MAEKVTIMVLKVDLQCTCCYKKIKKILCKYPQIRNQVYDEKGNTVTVTVVCCSPEKMRDKLCSKGEKVIKSIEIKDPKIDGGPGKPNVPDKRDGPGKPNKAEKPKSGGGKAEDKPKEAPKPKGPEPAANPPPREPAKLPAANPVNGIPPVFPAMACYGPSYGGYGGGAPWYQGYRIPPPPQPSYDGYYGYGHGYPYGRGCNFSRCDSYFTEENPSACSIM